MSHPKPTALKELEGNRGKRPLNKREPKPLPMVSMIPPKWLLPEAKKEWKRLAPALSSMGVLTSADVTAFAGYCQTYARWRQAEEDMMQLDSMVTTTKSGYQQQLPQVNIAAQCLKQMQSFCQEFGLTPASRSRIIAGGTNITSANEVDPMEAILDGQWSETK